MGDAQPGLGNDWSRTMDALWSLISVYDLMNHIMSLGRDIALRKEGILSAVEGGEVLDAGCGPGTMTKLVLNTKHIRNCEVTLVDASRSMLLTAKTRLFEERNKISLETAIMEHLPFRNEVFDAVVCGFSLRDAVNMEKALSELFRVLKERGRLLIVDLGKPDNRVMRFMIGVYWRFWVPFVARLVLGKRGKFYSALFTTYRLYPKNSKLQKLIEQHTQKVTLQKRMLGGAVMLTGEKP